MGYKGKILVTISITLYLLGVISSKIIMSGNILSGVFEEIDYLNDFSFWAVLFFGICSIFSFFDVASIKFI